MHLERSGSAADMTNHGYQKADVDPEERKTDQRPSRRDGHSRT